MRSRTILIGFISLLLLIWPVGPIFAVDAKVIPEFNPLCWKEKDCCDVRAQVLGKKCEDLPVNDRNSGWVTGEDPCSQDGWGKCLPAGKTVTKISFGGKTQFAHLGQFIQYIYRYAVTIAAIVAVIMVMLAGFQWVTSGGNSESITSAKKRIAGALMGLFLMYLSYFILNALNPALVNIRLPQVWMVRKQNTLTQFCSDLPKDMREGKNFFQVADSTKAEQEKKIIPPDKLEYNLTFKNESSNDKNEANFFCGKRFLVQGAGSQVCTGDYCQNSGQLCSNFDEKDPNYYFCGDATISGKITYHPLMGESGCVDPLNIEGWELPEITDVKEEELWAVCNKGSSASDQMSEVDSIVVSGNTSSDSQTYFMRLNADGWKELNDEVNWCNEAGRGGLKGFVVKIEMNESCDPKDENHWVGIDGNEVKDLGDDGFFLGSQNGKTNLTFINQKYFIPLERIQKGFRFDINADKITDIDEGDADRTKAGYFKLN